MSEDELLLPNYSIQRKVRRMPGKVDELLERAQVVVEHHSETCRDGLRQSVSAAEKICAEQRLAGSADQLRATVREMEDYASLLGYPTVADIARAVRRLLRAGSLSESAAAVIRLHIEAARLLLREERRDAQDPATLVLIEGLQHATKRLFRADPLPA